MKPVNHEMLEKFKIRAADLTSLEQILIKEVTASNRLVSEATGNKQFEMRTQVRTLFSCIEAYLSHLKQSALLFSTGEEGVFSSNENLALQDLESHLHESGEFRQRPAKIGLKTNLRLAFKAYTKSCGGDYSINYSEQGWRDFSEAIKIRDKITHPKSANSLTLTEADIQLVTKAWCWFGEHLVAVSKVSHSN